MPLLSRTVPVIVAKPRTLLPWAGAVIDSTTARTTSGVQNLKIVFIAVRPPGLPRVICEALVRTKTGSPITLSFDSQIASFRCLSCCSGFSLPISTARARETVTHVNAVILSHRSHSCQASTPRRGVILRRLFYVLRWIVEENKPAIIQHRHDDRSGSNHAPRKWSHNSDGTHAGASVGQSWNLGTARLAPRNAVTERNLPFH